MLVYILNNSSVQKNELSFSLKIKKFQTFFMNQILIIKFLCQSIFHKLLMSLLREVSENQKKKFDELKNKAESRFQIHQVAYQNYSDPTKLIEKRQIPNHQIPANDFIILIIYMLRYGLFGLKQQKKEIKQVQKKKLILLASNQIDFIYKNMKFLQATFFFPKMNVKQPRIKTFQPKQLTKEFKQIFRNVEIVLKIEEVAKKIIIEIQNYLIQNCHQKLKNCKPNQIITYISPLYQILEYVEKNYPWDAWKKQQILKGVNDIKNQNRKKQISELNFLQILLISYSREQIKKFRQLNPGCERKFEQIFTKQQEKDDEKQDKNQKEEYYRQRFQIDSSTKKSIKMVEKALIPKQNQMDKIEYQAQIEKLSKLEQKLKEKQKKTNEGNQSVSKHMKKLPKRINQMTQIKKQNLLILESNMNQEKNKKIVNRFVKLYKEKVSTVN